jgi:N utilization substance protein A
LRPKLQNKLFLQRLREAEREIVMAEYEDKIGTVVNGVVNRVEGRIVRVELGKAQGIMPVKRTNSKRALLSRSTT